VKTFLQRFGSLVAGVLQGFDRLVFKGRLQQLYAPQGMNAFCGRNRIPRDKFKDYAAGVTRQILDASRVAEAKRLGVYCYLNGKTDKDALAREIAAQHRIKQGLACVLQCVEPCWTFDIVRNKSTGTPMIRGERGKCTHLYQYSIDPRFGWMYVRLQTWFPFEIQIGMNGREYLSRQMDAIKLPYVRSDNKIVGVADWQRAQQLLDEQLRTDWGSELDRLQQQVHPLHPGHLGRMPLKYNWTVFQSEWATDVAFRSQDVLAKLSDRWLRQAFLSYGSVDVLRFLGWSGLIYSSKRHKKIETSVCERFEGRRIKHWVGHNSLKLYTHANVLRPETTINNADEIRRLRPPSNDPQGPVQWRRLRRSVADLPARAQLGQESNERYLEALATLAETRTVKELAEPLTERVTGPASASGKAARQVRGLNPLAKQDAALLTAISDPKWMVNGLRNRDLVAVLYATPTQDAKERRRRSSRVTRLLRLLRAHGLLQKIPRTHRYEVPADARARIQALLACRNANPDDLTNKAA
jgi:hypothetical protein